MHLNWYNTLSINMNAVKDKTLNERCWACKEMRIGDKMKHMEEARSKMKLAKNPPPLIRYRRQSSKSITFQSSLLSLTGNHITQNLMWIARANGDQTHSLLSPYPTTIRTMFAIFWVDSLSIFFVLAQRESQHMKCKPLHAINMLGSSTPLYGAVQLVGNFTLRLVDRFIPSRIFRELWF